MMTTIDKLNEILGHVLACASTLRRAELLSEDPGQRLAIRQLREACDVNCVNLAGAVNAFGGLPNRVPSQRFTLKLQGESIGDALDMAMCGHQHIVRELESLMDDPEIRSARADLQTVRQSHLEQMTALRPIISSGDL